MSKRYPVSTPEDIQAALRKLRASDEDPADHDERQNARTGVLLKAELAINGDRNNHYGPPDQDFTRSAGILNSLGYRALGGREILPHDIAVMALAIKLSRIVWSPEKEDHWVDVAGYAGCGYECVVRESHDQSKG